MKLVSQQLTGVEKKIIIDKNYVKTNLGDLIKDTDLSKFNL
jgi:ATP-dependent protease HslVU (ClpYQ), ATPase subunit